MTYREAENNVQLIEMELALLIRPSPWSDGGCCTMTVSAMCNSQHTGSGYQALFSSPPGKAVCGEGLGMRLRIGPVQEDIASTSNQKT